MFGIEETFNKLWLDEEYNYIILHTPTFLEKNDCVIDVPVIDTPQFDFTPLPQWRCDSSTLVDEKLPRDITQSSIST